MRRSVLGLDRVMATLLGVILLIFGIAMAAWYNGNLRRLWPQFPEELSTAAVSDIVNTTWWPWAAGGVGALAVLLGLWWLIAHLPRRSISSLVLPGSGRSGRLVVDPASPADTAAEVLRMLTHLPENQREAILLKFGHNLSYKEIAQVTGHTVGNVGFLIHTGIKTLRTRLTGAPV
jgi:hypothetical protein